MEILAVECLSCGAARSLRRSAHHLDGDCPRCGYVGWAPSAALGEPDRRLLRERPLERRRLLRVA